MKQWKEKKKNGIPSRAVFSQVKLENLSLKQPDQLQV